MAWARAFGCPVPEVFDAAAGDLVMERLHGPALGAALIAGRASGRGWDHPVGIA